MPRPVSFSPCRPVSVISLYLHSLPLLSSVPSFVRPVYLTFSLPPSSSRFLKHHRKAFPLFAFPSCAISSSTFPIPAFICILLSATFLAPSRYHQLASPFVDQSSSNTFPSLDVSCSSFFFSPRLFFFRLPFILFSVSLFTRIVLICDIYRRNSFRRALRIVFKLILNISATRISCSTLSLLSISFILFSPLHISFYVLLFFFFLTFLYALSPPLTRFTRKSNKCLFHSLSPFVLFVCASRFASSVCF